VLTLWPNVYISFGWFGEEDCLESPLEKLDLEEMFFVS